VTPEEIETVKSNALKQGIDLTQIAIFYAGSVGLASAMGSFTPDGRTVDCDGAPLAPEKILRFHYLGSD
jgi:hypothetical protein